MDGNHASVHLNKKIKNALMASTNIHTPVEFRLVYPVNVALTGTSLKNPVLKHKILCVSRVVLLGTTYVMAVASSAHVALMDSSRNKFVPERKILFVSVVLVTTYVMAVASRAHVALMDPSRNKFVLERKILFVSVVVVSTYDLAAVPAADYHALIR